jgi:hypothetical protein
MLLENRNAGIHGARGSIGGAVAREFAPDVAPVTRAVRPVSESAPFMPVFPSWDCFLPGVYGGSMLAGSEVRREFEVKKLVYEAS